MSGFDLRISGVGGDRFANRGTNTAHVLINLSLAVALDKNTLIKWEPIQLVFQAFFKQYETMRKTFNRICLSRTFIDYPHLTEWI